MSCAIYHTRSEPKARAKTQYEFALRATNAKTTVESDVSAGQRFWFAESLMLEN
jgi:hypothetical protein